MKEREPIKLTDSIGEMIIKMCEGNPGGLRVLTELAVKNPLVVLGLDDMNIRGWQIWVGYKDYCKQDLDLFIEKIKERSKEMIDIINEEARIMELPERAVRGGASFPK